MMTAKRAALWSGSSLLMVVLTACSAPAIHGFTMSAGPGVINIKPGGQATLVVATEPAPVSGAAVTASIILYYLPNGVTASPNLPIVTTGSQTTITLTAAADAPIGISSNVQITGFTPLAQNESFVTVNVVGSQ